MKRITLASKEAAEARSREEWEKHLGRKKRTGDVTEFMWSIDGATLLIPDEDVVRLSPEEQRQLSVVVTETEE